jgi:hypothetical protein
MAMYRKRTPPLLLGLIALWINPISPAAAAGLPEALAGECPGDYQVKPGLNVDFPIEGTKRAFVVVPPANLGNPAPVWVPWTHVSADQYAGL